LSIRRELVRLYPAVAPYRVKVLESRAALAGLWSGTGDHARALAEVTELEKDPDLIAGACYDLACACSLASAAIAKDPKLSPAERGASADACSARAVALLSRAVAMGYANVGGIKTDADLNAIRGRAEFKKLLRGLEAQKKAGGSPPVQ